MGELEKAVGGRGELCSSIVWKSDTGRCACGGNCVGEAVGELCFIHVSDPFTKVFNMLLCGMFK